MLQPAVAQGPRTHSLRQLKTISVGAATPHRASFRHDQPATSAIGERTSSGLSHPAVLKGTATDAVAPAEQTQQQRQRDQAGLPQCGRRPITTAMVVGAVIAKANRNAIHRRPGHVRGDSAGACNRSLQPGCDIMRRIHAALRHELTHLVSDVLCNHPPEERVCP